MKKTMEEVIAILRAKTMEKDFAVVQFEPLYNFYKETLYENALSSDPCSIFKKIESEIQYCFGFGKFTREYLDQDEIEELCNKIVYANFNPQIDITDVAKNYAKEADLIANNLIRESKQAYYEKLSEISNLEDFPTLYIELLQIQEEYKKLVGQLVMEKYERASELLLAVGLYKALSNEKIPIHKLHAMKLAFDKENRSLIYKLIVNRPMLKNKIITNEIDW